MVTLAAESTESLLIEWLNGGRSDPNAPLGFVFLFFYGLEYRLLKDGVHEDAPAIARPTT